MEDENIVEKAHVEHRVIITHDLDFSRILALSRSAVPSVITFRLSDMRPVCVNNYLSDVLARFTGQLEKGALVSVNECNIRVRLLPVEGKPPGSRAALVFPFSSMAAYIVSCIMLQRTPLDINNMKAFPISASALLS